MIKLRSGSSMIELVIAIVVMGIAMMTLPMMLTRVQSNNAFAMQQEAILMARTQIGDILTYPWDENVSFDTGVLETSSLNFKKDGNTTRRIGHIAGNKRRKFLTDKNASSIGADFVGEFPNDIDDFHDSDKNLTGENNTTNLGYKFSESKMKITVKYIDDNNTPNLFNFNHASTPTGTTNIKMVQLVLENNQSNTNLTLRAFTSNIGAGQLLRRDFP